MEEETHPNQHEESQQPDPLGSNQLTEEDPPGGGGGKGTQVYGLSGGDAKDDSTSDVNG